MEPPFRYTDAAGREWDVYDFKTVSGRKHRVPINRWDAEARAFVAADNGEVRIYKGYWSYHSTEPKLLANELRFSKPIVTTTVQSAATHANGESPGIGSGQGS